MSDIVHHHHSRLRRASLWVASKPETTAWIAFALTVMLVVEFGDHLLNWW